jgi:hypothetical protein
MALKKRDSDRYIFSARSGEEPVSWKWSIIGAIIAGALAMLFL